MTTGQSKKSTEPKNDELAQLDAIANEAHAQLHAAEGGAPGDAPGGTESPGATENTQSAEPAISETDAREIAEFVCEGLAGAVHEFIPALEFSSEKTNQAVNVVTPLVTKYAPLLSGEGESNVSVIRLLREYRHEGRAAWFFVRLIRESLGVLRQAQNQVSEKMTQPSAPIIEPVDNSNAMRAYGDE